MNCFNHPETPAVAICKNCHKGLCHSCLTEVENGIACTDTCVDQVVQVNQLVQTNKNITKRAPASLYRATFLYLAMALVFLYFGATQPAMQGYMFGVGGIFLIVGVMTLFSAARFKKNDR